jgi:tetratricopeptide (TPR) repeat protein
MRPEPRNVPGLAEALPALESSLHEDASPRNRMRVAEGLWLAGRVAEAVALLEPWVHTEPDAIAPRVLLAWAYEDLGRTGDAVRLWSAVRVLDPANPFALPGEAAGEVAPLEVEPNPEGAADAADTAHAVAEGAADAADAARAATEAPDAPISVAEPVPTVKAPSIAAPDAPPVARPAGDTPESQAEPARPLTREELAEIPPDPLYSATLAEIFAKQGFEEKAIQILQEVLRQHPDRSDLATRMAELERRLPGGPTT